MNRREIFRDTLAHRQPERVLVDFGKHIGSFHRRAYERLLKALNDPLIPSEVHILDRMAQNVVIPEALCQRLGIDFRWLAPHWVGVYDEEVNGASGYVDMWRTPHQYTEIGEYYAIAAQPLGSPELSLHDLRTFPWPEPDQPAMFDGLADQACSWREQGDYIIGADGIKVGILQTASQLRGYDKLFMDFALNPGLAHALLERLSEIINAMYAHYMQTVGPYVQVVVITDDQGTQKSLMVSPAMFRQFIKPRLQSLIQTIKRYAPHVFIFMHCDGAILPIIADLIEIGVDILNPIQNVVKGFEDLHALKTRFGDRLCFHGAIDVQQFLPNATPEAVRREAQQRIAGLGAEGGYILAPCHNINTDIPIENVIALFDAASHYTPNSRHPGTKNTENFI
jgi:uroporphyrinogen decarboxylase